METIEKDNGLRILIASKGYKIYSTLSNTYTNKVYLGVNDTIDNYREVIDEEYVDIDVATELKENQTINDEQDNMIIELATKLAMIQLTM